MKSELKQVIRTFGGFFEYLPSSKKGVKKIEKIFQTELPEDYKTFLLEYGYALPNEKVVKMPPAKNSSLSVLKVLYCFYGAGLKPDLDFAPMVGFDCSDVDSLCIMEEYRDNLPENFLPIGGDYSNITIGIILSRENFGHICLWDFFETPDNAEYEELPLLAESFYDFLTKLTIGTDQDLKKVLDSSY
ncbi:MAG: SMI1/KNR4 family protein [Spirochaetes bacterium]|nr:SMI1/KNR4 family protein [Spirochaetota bacterium]